MAENVKENKISEEEKAKTRAEAQAKMVRARVNDYVAIILAVGTVFLLWILQWAGLY